MPMAMFTHVLSFKYLNMLLAASASTTTTTTPTTTRTPTVADAVADVAAVAFEVFACFAVCVKPKTKLLP